MKNKLEIIKEAERFRSDNGLNSGEPLKIKSLLLGLNVQTFFLPLNFNISGMSVKTGDYRFMLINSNHPIGRQNFSILHECFHLFIQKDFDSMISSAGSFDSKDKNELNADWFSAFVLMPECGIVERIPDNELEKDTITLKTLLYLEHYYGCSNAALLRRLCEMEVISEKFRTDYKENIIANAQLNGYDICLYKPGRENKFIGDYGPTAKELYDNNLISESHFISLMQDIGVEIDFTRLNIASE